MKLIRIMIPALMLLAALTACDKNSCGCSAEAPTKTHKV